MSRVCLLSPQFEMIPMFTPCATDLYTFPRIRNSRVCLNTSTQEFDRKTLPPTLEAETATMSSHTHPRQSLAPSSLRNTNHTTSHTTSLPHSRLSTLPTQASKQRQLSHLNSQLAQLTAHMSDLENLLRMTAVQAEGMRGLGGYAGGMFMAASKVLGEEAVKGEGPEGR